MIDEIITTVDGTGAELAQYQISQDMGGVSIRLAPRWHTPAMLDMFAATMNQLAQKLRDQGVPE